MIQPWRCFIMLDVMVVPSRQENLPQTATEAHACGCPVVAFNCAGFLDVVEHKHTGYLAQPYEADDLAQGIRWILEDETRRHRLGDAARQRAVALWRPDVVVPQYVDMYERAIDFVRAKERSQAEPQARVLRSDAEHSGEVAFPER